MGNCSAVLKHSPAADSITSMLAIFPNHRQVSTAFGEILRTSRDALPARRLLDHAFRYLKGQPRCECTYPPTRPGPLQD